MPFLRASSLTLTPPKCPPQGAFGLPDRSFRGGYSQKGQNLFDYRTLKKIPSNHMGGEVQTLGQKSARRASFSGIFRNFRGVLLFGGTLCVRVHTRERWIKAIKQTRTELEAHKQTRHKIIQPREGQRKHCDGSWAFCGIFRFKLTRREIGGGRENSTGILVRQMRQLCFDANSGSGRCQGSSDIFRISCWVNNVWLQYPCWGAKYFSFINVFNEKHGGKS